ncbi:stage II sporulation protein M [Patulibacter defluvii]|uniref:stage II sporulation protein M n=1 Tax=Patulibacter defluvii TaxID=3095358 RepID=UPI002A7635BB|nr:stage II sporulation protein M [Patulibacter sp. DM4]
MASRDEVAAARVVARNAALRESRRALREWLRHPGEIVPWIGLSALIAATLLVCTLVVAAIASPDPSLAGQLIAADPSARTGDFLFVLGRNGTVLALHLMVCVATYLVRRSLPLQAGELRGLQRAVHHHAAKPALLIVAGLTAFSLLQQAVTLGHTLADVAADSHTSPALILVRLLPHAAPELTAVFLPLAAVMWLEKRERSQDLLAATIVCAVIAIPVVILSAWIEVAVASRFF